MPKLIDFFEIKIKATIMKYWKKLKFRIGLLPGKAVILLPEL